MFTFYRKYDNWFYVCFGHEGLSRNEGQAQSGGRYDGQSLLAWIDSGMLYETSRFIREASVSSTKLKLILAFMVIVRCTISCAIFFIIFFIMTWTKAPKKYTNASNNTHQANFKHYNFHNVTFQKKNRNHVRWRTKL